jgi:DNA-binding response OmpR family regulator
VKKPVVLIVDDEASIRDSIAVFLKDRFDIEVRCFGDGNKVIDFVQNEKADIIILDIKMPGKSGINVISEVKNIDSLIDILVISAWISDDVANESIREGATDYIVKPLEMKILEMKISGILEKRNIV